MNSLTHLTFFCASTVAATLACGPTVSPRVDHTAHAPIFSSVNAPHLTLDQTDDALARARRSDQMGADGSGSGELPPLSAAEHLRRASVYHSNRAFTEARRHWQAILARHPDDANVPLALFGIGRSLFQERRYAEALPVFEKLGAGFPQTEAGRDGFYYVAATLLRMNRAAEAAARYGEYTVKFPQGERIENAYLNVIDSLREAGRDEEALPWIARTREHFAGKPTEVNALFARLRLHLARGDWPAAIRDCDELSRARLVRGVHTSLPEISYLRAYSLERAGHRDQAINAYRAITDTLNSYYGSLATARLLALGGAAARDAAVRTARVRTEALAAKSDYPVPYRDMILRAASGRAVDPRLLLAIMRQESNFNPRAKSPAAARGLMQFTIDTAAKYAPRVMLNDVKEDDLYRPDVSIRLATEYLVELGGLFPELPEAVAASYNGGEDNVARWVKRAGSTDPGVFTSEVGFTESKDYVAKVMTNLRAYRQLYTEDLRLRP